LDEQTHKPIHAELLLLFVIHPAPKKMCTAVEVALEEELSWILEEQRPCRRCGEMEADLRRNTATIYHRPAEPLGILQEDMTKRLYAF
jgi:hypothetical protein